MAQVCKILSTQPHEGYSCTKPGWFNKLLMQDRLVVPLYKVKFS